MNTAPATVTKFAGQISVDDVIVTKHGRNFGTVEIESIAKTSVGPDGMQWFRVTGYQMVNAGVCGPWATDVRGDEAFNVEAR